MPGNNRSGRRPDPHDLKVFKGNPGKRKIKPSPKADGVPVMPRGMRPDAQKMWKLVVPMLTDLKIAKAIDTTMLQSMCEWYARYRELMFPPGGLIEVAAECNLDEALMMVLYSNLQDVNRPAKAFAMFERVASRFGLTPADRAKLIADCGSEGNGESADPTEGYFASG